MTRYINLIEPPDFPVLFFEYPPDDFAVNCTFSGLPLFRTKFDFLTTLEIDIHDKLQRVPFFSFWSRLFKWRTCFAGTTITEYLPLPSYDNPQRLIEEILRLGGGESVTVIKDLPCASPLLSQAENDYAQELVQEGVRHGFWELSGQALAYVPIDFSSVEEYLDRLSYNRRKEMRRKLRSAAALEIQTIPLGSPVFAEPELLSEYYSMYVEVFQQSKLKFDFLKREFFQAMLSGRFGAGLVVIYKNEGSMVCYNICLLHNDMLIDKYIGFKYPLARQFNLYFISWLYNLELALERGCKFYVAGWTDPEVKQALGAQFTFTRHLVRIKNPALRKLLYPLRHCFEADRMALEGL